MKYDFQRDLTWLILRPWILVPRFIQIVGAISLLLARLIFQGSSNEDKTQKKLAKFLLKTLIDLGPCFIKVGQALSTRPDLIRKDWLEELTNLQDNLPSFSHEKALEIIENELGKPASELFEEFPSKPIASASLGQVYKAKLFGDYWVAVKVQRPNLIFNIRRDIVIIKILGVLSAPILPLNLGFGLGEIIDEFGRSLFDEVDYKKEANNAEKFSNLFHNNNSVTIPTVERHLTTIKVLINSSTPAENHFETPSTAAIEKKTTPQIVHCHEEVILSICALKTVMNKVKVVTRIINRLALCSSKLPANQDNITGSDDKRATIDPSKNPLPVRPPDPKAIFDCIS